MEGGKRYTEGRLTAPVHDLEMLRGEAQEKQEPFASVLACADSRAPWSWYLIRASDMSWLREWLEIL
jgi:carbonic anhydrase